MPVQPPPTAAPAASIAPITWSALLVCVLVMSLSVVPTGLRAQDAKATLRLQILADEDRTERTRLEEARKRFVDRTQARDAVGAREAEAAIARHEANIKALATELGSAERAAPASAKPTSPTQKTNATLPPPMPTAQAAQPARWWDVYDRPAQAASPAALPPSLSLPLSSPAPTVAVEAARAATTPFQPTARRLP